MTAPSPALAAEALEIRYGRRVILPDLTLDLPAGRVTAIVGPNGCGKSTLLGALARLLTPARGQVIVDGQVLARLSPRQAALKLGLLPQSASAPEGLTVLDLVRFGRHPHQGLLRQWSAADQAAVERALTDADVAHLAERPLDQLSGGQRQRAWIALAIAQEAPCLLLDEPTAFLDLGHQLEVYRLVRRLTAAGRTVVVVLHDLTAACRYADHLVAMKDGRVVAAGTPAEVVTPALVETLYGVSCTLLADPVSGTPILAGLDLR